jgi:hypothetical protein
MTEEQYKETICETCDEASSPCACEIEWAREIFHPSREVAPISGGEALKLSVLTLEQGVAFSLRFTDDDLRTNSIYVLVPAAQALT